MNLENLLYKVSKNRKNLYLKTNSPEKTIKNLTNGNNNQIYFFDTSVLNSSIHVIEHLILNFSIQKNIYNDNSELSKIIFNLYGQLKAINKLALNQQIASTTDIKEEFYHGIPVFRNLIKTCYKLNNQNSFDFPLENVWFEFETLFKNSKNFYLSKKNEGRVNYYFLRKYKNSSDSVLEYYKKEGYIKEPSDADLKLYLNAYLLNQTPKLQSSIITFDSDIIVQGLCSAISPKTSNAPEIIFPTSLNFGFLEKFSTYQLSLKNSI